MLALAARLTVLMGLLSAFPAHSQVAGPEALVKSTVSEVLEVIRQTREPRQLVQLAESKVLPHFDFSRMTRLAVGRSWTQANAEQQAALVRGFRTLLVRTYTVALSQSSGQAKVAVKPGTVKPGDADAVVRTVVEEPNRKPLVIDYRMTNASGQWKVYDVVVENLSLVTNYRGSFQSEIKRSGIDGLIKAIETKNQQAG